MAKNEYLELTPEEEALFLESLDYPGVFVDTMDTGLRSPDPNDLAYNKWKKQNGKA